MKCCAMSMRSRVNGIAGAHRREAAILLILRLLVAPFLVELEETVEGDDLARGAQVELSRSRLRHDIGRGALDRRALHLARDRANPDELVKPCLIGLEQPRHLFRMTGRIGRTDRFMRLLSVLRFVRVATRRRRQIGLAVLGLDHPPYARDRFRRHVDAVGAHVSDEADRFAIDVHALVKPLRDAHRHRRRKAELARGFLLQGRGGEGRKRVTFAGLRLDLPDAEARRIERGLEGLGLGCRADIEPRDLLAIGADEARFEGGARRRLQLRGDRPIFARHETLDLELPIANEAERDRLHAPGRTRARELAPEHRR